MATLSTQLFDFDLPASLIAQHPTQKRDASRLFVFNRKTGKIDHGVFRDILDYLPPQTALIRNNVSVLKARIHARTSTDKPVECFLLKPTSDEKIWWCLLKPSKKIPVGEGFGAKPHFQATVLEKSPDGLCLVAFESELSVLALSEALGEIPLPPYIKSHSTEDERYQTVYANASKKSAVAAPTAGLHFTPELLQKLSTAGIPSYDLTLHVGLGTFQPIKTEAIQEHPMHAETYEMPAATANFIQNPAGATRLAVGTTSTRAIEHYLSTGLLCASNDGLAGGDLYQASIFIYPPYVFKGVDALLTNFHLPRSTLLCLLAAFLSPGSTEGIALFKKLYQEAIACQYRFFSYGDAMLIV